ncbi:MAG TPA: hypothetical protein VFW85_00355 [Gaiellaceae bacterium]|nr:hypothetical protein [Gaiellaceae bacterium]
MQQRLEKDWPVWLVSTALLVVGIAFGISYAWSPTALAVILVVAYAIGGLTLGAIVFVHPPRSVLGTRLSILAWMFTTAFAITATVKVFTNEFDSVGWSLPMDAFASGAIVLSFVTHRLPRRKALPASVALGLTAVVIESLGSTNAIDDRGRLLMSLLERPLAAAAIALAIAASDF